MPNSQELSNTVQQVEGFPDDYESTANLWPVDFCINLDMLVKKKRKEK